MGGGALREKGVIDNEGRGGDLYIVVFGVWGRGEVDKDYTKMA